jgi:hypothetical protein
VKLLNDYQGYTWNHGVKLLNDYQGYTWFHVYPW